MTMISALRGKLETFLRFLAVGAGSTAVHYAVLIACVEWLHWRPVAATALGYLSGALVNYLLNRWITFDNARAHRHGAPRFLIMVIGGWTLNTTLVWWMSQHLLMYYLLAQIVATAIVLVVNFLTLKFWVFPERFRRNR